MTQYNPNPNLYANTTGWSTSAGTLTAAASPEGGRVIGSAPLVTSPFTDYLPSTTPIELGVVYVRRNTATGQPRNLNLYVNLGLGNELRESIDLRYGVFPIGVWIPIPLTGSYASVGPGTRRWQASIKFDGSVNFNIKGFNLSDTSPSDVDLDANDAAFTSTIPNNSLTVPFKHSDGSCQVK